MNLPIKIAIPGRRFFITILVAAAGLIGSIASLYVGVNTDTFRQWFETELSHRSGYAIGMNSISLSPPLRLVVSGVTAGKDGKRILSAAKLHVTFTPMDIFTKTIHRLDVERPELELDLADLLKSRSKSEITFSLRNLSLTDGRAVIRTEDGNSIEIPGIDLTAQNINLGGQTGIALRAEIPTLNAIADIAIERRNREFSLHATVNTKRTTGLFRRGSVSTPQGVMAVDGVLRMPLGQDPNADVELNFNQFQIGPKAVTGKLKTSAALDKNFAAGTFSSRLDLSGFPNSVSPVALQTNDGPAVANANGTFSLTAKSITLKSLTLRSHLGDSEASGNLAFTPAWSVTDGHIIAHNLDWQEIKALLPAPFNQWSYRGHGELEMKLRGPWKALEISGFARSDDAQMRAANFTLANFSLRAPFQWSNGKLAVHSGRIDGKKLSFEDDKLKSAVTNAEISAISYDSKNPGRVTAQVHLTGGQFASADNSTVGEALALDGAVEVTANTQRKATSIAARLSFTAGELLWGKFFGDLKLLKPALLIDAEYDRDIDRLQCRSCEINLATVGQVNLAGGVEKISQTPQFRLQARSDNLSPTSIFQHFVRETYHRQYPLLDKLAVNGQMAIQLQLDGGADRLAIKGNLSLKNGEIASGPDNWQLAAISMNLPFQVSLDEHPIQKTTTPALGALSIERARFGKQQLAPMTATISLADNLLQLHQPLRLSIFGGEVELRSLTWRDIVHDAKSVTFSAQIKQLQLQDLTEAFNWPRFSGQLSGAIPEVESAGNTLRSHGEILAEVFGGRLRLSKLEIENPFSDLASIKMSAKLESIDLEQLSKTFSFGRISGILEGSVDDLVITDGQPSQLRADVHSVERRGVDQRISVDALNKITVLSSGQEAGALYSGLAGFFDSFRYSKLGFKAVLRNDRLILRGVESQGDKEMLVVGSFLPPTVNIISHNQEIAFSELLRRLERIKTDKPTTK